MCCTVLLRHGIFDGPAVARDYRPKPTSWPLRPTLGRWCSRGGLATPLVFSTRLNEPPDRKRLANPKSRGSSATPCACSSRRVDPAKQTHPTGPGDVARGQHPWFVLYGEPYALHPADSTNLGAVTTTLTTLHNERVIAPPNAPARAAFTAACCRCNT
jgi:hypothetical protein